MEPCMQRALMFVGAVIGAGFASGREVFSFFTCYGPYSWLLILISAGTMAFLCGLCLQKTGAQNGCHWCSMYCNGSLFVRRLAQGCVLLMQVVMGGSMVSAAGHIAALALPFPGAYLLGAAATIALALFLGYTSMKPLAVLGSMLATLLVGAVFAVLVFDYGEKAVAAPAAYQGGAGYGAVRAVGYAAMNVALSMGVICRCGEASCRISYRTSVVFGFCIALLLVVSNYLYLKHPELQAVAFPLVALLGRFGKAGYGLSLVLLYLAILTTLSAGLYALRTGLTAHFSRPAAFLLALLLPLAVSCVGFANIVQRWYTPIGLLCLLMVFGPLFVRYQRENLS